MAGPAAARNDFETQRKALNAAGGALFDLSASCVAWMVSGEGAYRALSRGCPLDLDPHAIPAGRCAQSMLGHVNALLHRPGEQVAFMVMVPRSFAGNVSKHLSVAVGAEA
jgi:sarcosine oxidase, subunit gamma